MTTSSDSGPEFARPAEQEERDGSATRSSRRLDLRPGHEIQVQALNSRSRIVARYVGQCENRYLILRNGSREEDRIERMRFVQDEMVLARFVLHGVAFGFRAPVLAVHRVPDALLYLQWPDEVAEHAIRSAMRVPCFAAARLEVGETVHQAALTDVSETGCRVDLIRTDPGILAEGAQVRVWAYLPGQTGAAEIDATVRRHQQPGGGRLVLGLEFTQSQEALLETVRAYLPDLD